jgi:hypothetical protein
MVACDNDACPREWFHLSCVGLTKPPGKNGMFISFLGLLVGWVMLIGLQLNGIAMSVRKICDGAAMAADGDGDGYGYGHGSSRAKLCIRYD